MKSFIYNLNKIFNNENKTRIIGLLTILIGLWLVLYFIPEIFVSLFNNILGNLILFIVVLLIFMNNKMYGLVIGLIIIIIIRLIYLSKEGFTPNSEQTFLGIEYTTNRQKVFDMDIINQQATQEEIDYYNENSMWPWSQQVIDLYKDALTRNTYVRSLPDDGVLTARKVYNQNAILRALSYQTKEGQFLINGVLVQNPNSVEELPNGFGDFGYNSGLSSDNTKDLIKCNLFKSDNNPPLERITYTGNGGIFNQQTKKTENVDYNNLENIIPGFKFVGSPCNPCESMGANPNYSCKFNLDVNGEDSSVSNVWNYLWGN
jgi:hypothetical protein